MNVRLSQLLASLVQSPSNRVLSWIETIMITGAVPAVGFLVNRQDPFFLQADFPWSLFAPLLVGLRYGVGLSVMSAAGVIVGVWLLGYFDNPLSPSPPVAFSAGVLLMAMICGQFRESWDQELGRCEIDRDYNSRRIAQLGRSHEILMASHNKLEQVLGGGVSMRSALKLARENMMASTLTGEAPRIRFAESVLNLFCEYGDVQIAAVYQCSPSEVIGCHTAPSLGLKRLAIHGEPHELSPDNPLLQQALRSRKTSVAAPHQLANTDGVRAVTPIVDATGQVWCVVVINEMAAFDYSHKTFELLTLIGDYVGDGFHGESGGDGVSADSSIVSTVDCWSQTVKQRKVSASLLVLCSEDRTLLSETCELLRKRSRSLDHVWLRECPRGVLHALALFPLTNVSDAMTCMQRIEDERRRLRSGLLPDNGVQIEAIALNGQESAVKILAHFDDTHSTSPLALSPRFITASEMAG